MAPSLVNCAATGLGVLGPVCGCQLADRRPEPAGSGVRDALPLQALGTGLPVP